MNDIGFFLSVVLQLWMVVRKIVNGNFSIQILSNFVKILNFSKTVKYLFDFFLLRSKVVDSKAVDDI